MTGLVWAGVAVLAVFSFVAGGVTAIRWKKREERWSNALGVVFSLVAVLAVIDLVNLHIGHEQTVECNMEQNHALISIALQREAVDRAAIRYDEALLAFLNTPVFEREPTDPASRRLSETLRNLIAVRSDDLLSKEHHPIPEC